MAKAVPVHVRLSRTAVDMEFLRKALETLHSCVVMEAIKEPCYSEQQRMVLCSTIQEKLPYHDTVKDETA